MLLKLPCLALPIGSSLGALLRSFDVSPSLSGFLFKFAFSTSLLSGMTKCSGLSWVFPAFVLLFESGIGTTSWVLAVLVATGVSLLLGLI